MSEQLPERINVMKVITYDVQQIVNDLIESGHEDGAVTIDDVMEYIDSLVQEDFGCGWGHTANTGDLIYQTSDGEDL